MKKLFLLILGLGLIITSNASEKNVEVSNKNTNTSISGVVIDKITGEPLAGVEVQLLDSNEKVFTDFDGQFQFNKVEKGAHAIKINYISYELVVENVNTEKENTTLNIKLSRIK